MRLHFENDIFVVLRSSSRWPFAFNHLITWLRGVDSVEKEQIMRQYVEPWR